MLFIVAEIGAAHNQSLKRAIQLVDLAASAGADAVKVQCYTADTMVADKTAKLTEGPWAGYTLHDLYARGSMPWAWIPIIFERAKEHGMTGFATPFDETAVDFLESIDCPIYKVASIEITDLPLIRRIARTGKPIIISTGMATRKEIERAIRSAHGCADITLLKCTSAYPAPIEDLNLATMQDMQAFLTAIGLSDHTQGSLAAVIAIALYGATVIEKHITLEHEDGLDDGFATTPDEFAQFVADCRNVEKAIGTVKYGPTPAEHASMSLRRSLYVVRDVKAGQRLTEKDVRARRPWGEMGEIAPDWMPAILGVEVNRDIAAGTPLQINMLTSQSIIDAARKRSET